MPGYTDVMGYLDDENSSLEYLFDLFAGAGGMGSTDPFVNVAGGNVFGTEDFLGDAGSIMDAWGQYATEGLIGTQSTQSDLGSGSGRLGEFDPTDFFDASEEEMRDFLGNYLQTGLGVGADVEGGVESQDWIDEFMENLEGVREGQKMILTPEQYGLEEKLASAKGKARRGTKKAGAKYIPREIASRYGELQGRLAGGTGEASEAAYASDVYGLQREAGTAGRDIRQDFADEYYGSVADWMQSMQ